MAGGGNRTNNNPGALSPMNPGVTPEIRQNFQDRFRNLDWQPPQVNNAPTTSSPPRNMNAPWRINSEDFAPYIGQIGPITPRTTPGTPERTFGTPGTNPQSAPPKRPGGK